jgi:(1->4)-alpha-D-glucan 1-alpha-D-glucosylmutase
VHRQASTAGLDRNAEYLLYQVLVGAWPLDADRAVAYMEKASKEAKVHTSWTSPVIDYDESLAAFVRDILADETFVAEVKSFVAPLVRAGRVNSLAQTLIKLTAPGVPDVYQGTEVWDLSLVDPDNRRPVDYGARRRLLERIERGGVDAALAAEEEGGPKMLVVRRALALRSETNALAGDAAYEALPFSGEAAEHGIGYLRGGTVAVVAPRLSLTLERAGGWRDTTVAVPEGDWVNVLTGDRVDSPGSIDVSRLTERLPVALLTKGSAHA